MRWIQWMEIPAENPNGFVRKHSETQNIAINIHKWMVYSIVVITSKLNHADQKFWGALFSGQAIEPSNSPLNVVHIFASTCFDMLRLKYFTFMVMRLHKPITSYNLILAPKQSWKFLSSKFGSLPIFINFPVFHMEPHGFSMSCLW